MRVTKRYIDNLQFMTRFYSDLVIYGYPFKYCYHMYLTSVYARYHRKRKTN